MMKLLSFSLCFIIINTSFALDFEKAWKNNKFRDIESNTEQWIVHPERFPSVSLYYDKYRRNTESSDSTENNSSGSQWSSELPTKKIEIILENDFASDDDVLTTGLSIVFLKFTGSSKIVVNIDKEYTEAYLDSNQTLEILPDIHLPTTNYLPTSLVRSYPQEGEKGSVDRIKVTLLLTDWKYSNQLYFTVTSYMLGKQGTRRQHCRGDSHHHQHQPDWWDCNSGSADLETVLCIDYSLTCDDLPNCGKLTLPNPDENCVSNSLQAALRLLVYCLLTIFLVLLIAGCTRCCLRGFCSRSRFSRRGSDIVEIIGEDECRRPDNSPPSYEDAMKYVNEAFESSQGENAEAPPTYSPTPAAGEEICSPTFPSLSPVEPGSAGEFSFDNNFVDLPSDPPPYSIQPTPAPTTTSAATTSQ